MIKIEFFMYKILLLTTLLTSCVSNNINYDVEVVPRSGFWQGCKGKVINETYFITGYCSVHSYKCGGETFTVNCGILEEL